MWGGGGLIDERRKALVIGHHSAGDSIRGPGGGVFYWGTRKMRFLRDMQNAL
jgi:hypothetical protein